MTRRRQHIDVARGLRGVESTVLSQGATGVIGALGFAFPGFGLILGVLLSRLFADEPPTGATIEWWARLQRMGELTKARQYADANALWNLGVFQQAADSMPAGFEKLFFISRMGYALTKNDRAAAFELARYIDTAQSQWNAWAANVDTMITGYQADHAAKRAAAAETGEEFKQVTADQDDGFRIPGVNASPEGFVADEGAGND